MTGLMAAADIVISLHRSEGFGLVPAQAMALGKPVVATAWSGNVDFMNERNSAPVSYSLVPVHDPEGAFQSDNQKWAEANVEEAALWLRAARRRRRPARPHGRRRGQGRRRATLAQAISPARWPRSSKPRSAADVAAAHRDQWPLPHPARVRRAAFRHGDDQGDRCAARRRLCRAQGPHRNSRAAQRARFSAQEYPAPPRRIFLRLHLGTDRVSAARRRTSAAQSVHARPADHETSARGRARRHRARAAG